MATNLTLGDYFKQLALRMDDEKLVMEFKNEKPWHLLFYKLKKAKAENKPPFLSTLRFDWDGPYPRCQELSEYIQALHWTGSVVVGNPSYDRLTLQAEVRKIWSDESNDLSAESREFVNLGLELAAREFSTQ